MIRLKIIAIISLLALNGCANLSPNDKRAKDFTLKQLEQLQQLIDVYAAEKGCNGFTLLARQEGIYPSDTTRRIQHWQLEMCGTRMTMIAMTRKRPKDGWEVCIHDSRPCAIPPTRLNGLKPGEE